MVWRSFLLFERVELYAAKAADKELNAMERNTIRSRLFTALLGLVATAEAIVVLGFGLSEPIVSGNNRGKKPLDKEEDVARQE